VKFYTASISETLAHVGSRTTGLTALEASRHLKKYGPNAIIVKGVPLWKRLVEPFANVMMGVLTVAVIISIWHHAYFDALVIGAIMLVSAIIFYVQQFSTERILKSLRQKSTFSVDVLRGDRVSSISVELLVPGDIVLIDEGEKIPADIRLISASSLRVDESQLTGESIPIDKSVDALEGHKELYEQTNMVFQGSFVVSGEATGVVVATGNQTEFGKLAKLSTATSDKSPIQHKIDRLLRHIIAIVGAIALISFALSLYRGMELTEALRFVIAMAVSAVPESLPVAISIILALGMRRMAAKKALVRSMNAIETIGAVTTIATDKTGTLTVNKLAVQTAWHPGVTPYRFKKIVEHTINVRSAKLHDPLDTALQAYTGYDLATHQPVLTFPFDQATAMSGNVWHDKEGSHLYIKGAPEMVLAHSDMDASLKARAHDELIALTSAGFRVIAIAHTITHSPVEALADIKRSSLHFAGFVGVADTLRPEAARAIRTAQRAGITVRMITGDHFETAYQIGKTLGLVSDRSQVFDSRQLATLSETELDRIVNSTFVFSRVIPEHKHMLLSALKRQHITAMTGDGVNDVPALTNAHVGLAMGSGTQIAKDAGDIILVDDNFKSIVDAVHEGRTIYSNIKRMLYYLLATSTGEVLTTVGALVVGLPIPLAPVQILWINLVTDTALVIPLGLEPGEKRNMLRPPQLPHAPILSKFMVSRMILVSLTMAVFALTTYAQFSAEFGHAYASTITFNLLVVMQWASALCARSDYEPLIRRIFRFNPAFVVGFVIAVALQLSALFTPLANLLHVTPVALHHLALTSLAGFLSLIVIAESHKILGRAFFGKGSHPIRIN
jgi:Ca2+-transporting ATPase